MRSLYALSMGLALALVWAALWADPTPGTRVGADEAKHVYGACYLKAGTMTGCSLLCSDPNGYGIVDNEHYFWYAYDCYEKASYRCPCGSGTYYKISANLCFSV